MFWKFSLRSILVFAFFMTAAVTTPPVLAGGGAGGGGSDPSSAIPKASKKAKKAKKVKTKRSRKVVRQSQKSSKKVAKRSSSKVVAAKKKATTQKTARRNVERRVIQIAAIVPPEANPLRLAQVAALSGNSGVPPVGEQRFVPDEVLVQFAEGTTDAVRAQIVAANALEEVGTQSFEMFGATLFRYRLTGDVSVPVTLLGLEGNPAITAVQPNYLYETTQQSSGVKLAQYANDRLGLSLIHEKVKGEGAKIAIIDTAIVQSHPELANVSLSTHTTDPEFEKNVDPHGTSIAGIIAAQGRLTGVAPAAELIGIAAFAKSADGKARGNTWSILKALDIAFDKGAKVINMSFAGPSDPAMLSALNGAKNRNLIPIAAAGNNGVSSKPLFPAAYDSVFAVTAINSNDEVYAQANRGDYVDFAAPGVQVLTIKGQSGFGVSSGTSLATAYVSGLAALLVSINQQVTYEAFAKKFQASSIDLGRQGRDQIFGYGMPSAKNILENVIE